MKLQNLVAITTAKSASWLSQKLGKEGQNLPGKLGLRISPSILGDLSQQVRQKTIMVCGTNGKTTTNNVLAELCEKAGYEVIANRSGANMRDGIASSFILASRGGKIDCDIACLESDEAWARHTIKDVPVDMLVVTNLFRDQLDRYGEIDTTMDYLLQAINLREDLKLLVNGDDALAVALALKSGKPFLSFGVEESVLEQQVETREATYCPMCSKLLEYDFYHYSQLGHYHCSCGFKRPDVDYKITNVNLQDGLSFKLNGTEYSVEYRGFYNVYNLAAAIATIDALKLNQTNLSQHLSEFSPRAGRNQEFSIGGVDVILNLAKNPAGFNQNLQALLSDPEDKDILIGINDNYQDGRDVSWLWDVAFDKLNAPEINTITTTGSRAGDMALRLKYDELMAEPNPSLAQAIDALLEKKPKKAYILVNYTLLKPTHDYLENLARRQA